MSSSKEKEDEAELDGGEREIGSCYIIQAIQCRGAAAVFGGRHDGMRGREGQAGRFPRLSVTGSASRATEVFTALFSGSSLIL